MKYLFLVAALYTASFLFGQNPMKKYPLKDTWSVFHERTMIFNSKLNEDMRMKKALVDTKITTEEQFNKVLKYAKMEEYPDALNTADELTNINKSHTGNYKAYWIGSWTEFFPAINNFRQLHLIWIPKEDNLNVESGYVPKTEEGFYVITRNPDYDKQPFFSASTSTVKSIVEKLEKRKLPVSEKLDDLYNKVMPDYGHAMGSFYSELKTKYNLTDDEIDIVSRSAAIDAWPDSLNLTKRRDLAYPKLNDFTYYKIGEHVGEYGVNGLFWIAPNQNFTDGFIPKSALGYFFVAEIDKTKKTPAVYEKNDLAFLNTPWWIKNVSVASYNPTTFTFSNQSSSSSSIATTTSSSNNSGGFTTTTVNGITIATANLERKNKRSGVMILYFGSNRIISNVSLFVVEIDKSNSEDGIAESLQRRVAGSSPYMYFEFKEGFDCSNAQGYLRKKGISPPSCTY